MSRADIGIDLGTANVLVYVSGKGIVLEEPSVVAIDKKDNSVLAVGEEARRMIGRTPGNIVAIRPLRDGVISDYDVTEKMLKYFIDKVVEPIAAAIGAGIDISQPHGNMVIDIGGGTADVAVISLGGAVVSESIKIGGDKFDEAIVRYMKKQHNLLIGERTAEKIKIEIGCAYKREEEKTMRVTGRNLITGLPYAIEVSSSEMLEALDECVEQIVVTAHVVLEKTPPELAADISDRGIIMTGGGSLLYGLDKRIEERTGIKVIVANEPLSCVAAGTGKALSSIDLLKSGGTFNKK